VVQTLESGTSYQTELRGKQTKVAGIFKLGLTFAADINLIMSAANFQTYFHEKSNDDIQIGVIQISSNANEAQAKATMASFLDPSLEVLTIEQLKSREVSHWQRNTSFGLIFNLGVLVGLAVGGIIVYRILYSDVDDHLSEYATMKAIGYGNSFAVGIILQESLLLATVAFSPSLLLSVVLYQFLARATGLLVVMSLGRALFVFLLTLALCSASGWLATGKLRRLDPAEVF
jgi:putative ABC transport system permease protein